MENYRFYLANLILNNVGLKDVKFTDNIIDDICRFETVCEDNNIIIPYTGI